MKWSCAIVIVLAALGFVVPTLLIILVALGLLRAGKTAQARTVNKTHEVDADLERLRQAITCVTGSTIAGSEIRQVLGVVRGLSDTQAISKEQFALAEKEALRNLLAETQRLGGNAVIDLRLTSGSYSQNGQAAQVAQAVYTGTAVQLISKSIAQ